jgi:thermitase
MKRQRILLVALALLLAVLAWQSGEPRRPVSRAGLVEDTGVRVAGGGSPEPGGQDGTGASPVTRRPVFAGAEEDAGQNRYAGADVLEASVSEPDGTGVSRRERLLRNPGGKYPLLRVEEQWQRTPSGQDVLRRQKIMAADHVIVQLHDGDDPAVLQQSLGRQGFSLQALTGVPRGYRVVAAPAMLGTVPALLAALSANPGVAVSEPDYVYFLDETRPDDPRYASLWGMEKIGMPLVWDATKGTGAVVVAVFDTGMDLTHPDLAANRWINSGEIADNGIDDDGNGYPDDIYGWDFYSKTNDPSDISGHGTHVAGTIGAVGHNGIGVAGVAWKVRILPVKFFGMNSYGQLEGFASDAMEGMYYVIAQSSKGVPVRVTNHSWGGPGESQLLRDAFRIAEQYGILHVAAAGNGGVLDNDAEPHFPSSFDLSNMVAVANTTSSDGLSAGSHYGTTTVDLGAPGEGIWSCLMRGDYGVKTGTSMASPHVVGVAALLFDLFPELTWPQVRDLIFSGVAPLPALSGRCTTGGRLSASGTFARIAPQITHGPLQNTALVGVDITVAAEILPGGPFVASALLQWNTTGSTYGFTTQVMQNVEGNRFEAILPGQAMGTTIHYRIRVESTAGIVSVHPLGDPMTLHRFSITHPVSLRVYGYPSPIGVVEPGYGESIVPWGSSVVAVAPAVTDPQNGRRWRCDGWYGSGSVPFSGITNRVHVEMRDPSYLMWRWKAQTSRVQVSDPPGVLAVEHWADADTTVGTVEAPATAMVGPVVYAFIGWSIDGVRFPDNSAEAVNPAFPLPADAPRMAVARYIPALHDKDSDGLPDWWEWFHFNHLSTRRMDDPDGDGFSNAAELDDHSSPANSRSVPEGPAILHDPLPVVVGTPAPWRIEATVTDRVAVAVAVLRWQRNGGAWNEVRMTADGDRRAAMISAPAMVGDDIAYQIVAEDVLRYTTVTPVYAFQVRYPVLLHAPGEATLSVNAGDTTPLRVQVTNAGNADLVWETVSGLDEPVSADPGGWTQGGTNSLWHVSTRESYSAPYSWFCGDAGGGAYNHSMDASLYTPPITLGGAPRLRFRHWPEMEYDGSDGFEDYYWDGAVVEISRDGVHYENLDPVGGYPYRITPNTNSPFAAHRPCFGGVTGGWQAVEFDLAAYAGETVQVRFRFGTDRYVEERGWFIDDIMVTWGAAWLEAPAGGTVAGGASAVVELRLNALELTPGTYRGAWTARSNAPGSPSFAVPVTLQVNAPPPEASMRLNAEDAAGFVLTWMSQTGRTYHLSSSTGLSAGAIWRGVPRFTNLAGRAGSMSYTGRLEAVPFKYYRIQEQIP